MLKRKSVILSLAIFGCALSANAENTEAQAQPQVASPQAQPVVGQPAPSANQVQWFTNYQEAAQKAKAEKKALFLFFTGSDWCGWCKKMESEILAAPDFAALAGNRFVFVMLDFPMNQTLPPDITEQNAQLKQKYGVTGYPTVIILDSNENFVAETGYRSGGGKAYADYLFGLVH